MSHWPVDLCLGKYPRYFALLSLEVGRGDRDSGLGIRRTEYRYRRGQGLISDRERRLGIPFQSLKVAACEDIWVGGFEALCFCHA